MRLKALAQTALVSLGLSAPAEVVAQTLPAAGAARDFTIGVRATGTYDSNSAAAGKQVQDDRGLKEEDYVLNTSLTARIVQPIGRQSAYLQGDVGYDFHRYNAKLDSRRASLNAGVAGQVGPCAPSGTLGYRVGQSDLANLDADTTKNVAEVITYGVSVSCARALGPGVSMSVQRADTTNSAAQLKEANSTVDSASIGLGYGLPSIGTFTVSFSYTDADYPNRVIPGGPVGDGFFSQAYSLSYGRDFGDRISVGLSGGLSHLKRDFVPPGVDASINVTNYGANLNYALGRRINISAQASRSLTPSQVVGKSYDITTTAGINVGYDLGSAIRLSSGYNWTEANSNADTASTLEVITRSTTNAVSGAVSYAPNDIMSLTLNVQWTDRTANLPEFNFNSIRVGVSAQANF